MSRAGKRSPLVLLLAVLLTACGSHRLATGELCWDVQLIAHDTVARPGEVIEVQGKLEHRDLFAIRPNLRGYPLCFHSPPFLEHCWAWTAHRALATVPFQAPAAAPGPCRVRVCFPGSRHHRPAVCVSRVFVWPEDCPILVTDVDHTISNLPQFLVPFTSNEETLPLPGAPEALQELSQKYRIVYLTARNHCLYNRTRDWLCLHGFPEGPLFTRECAATMSVTTFKRRTIEELQRRYPHVVVGVGDRGSDAEAYLTTGLKTILINPKKPDKLPPEVIIVGSWPEVARHLCGSRSGTPDPGEHRGGAGW